MDDLQIRLVFLLVGLILGYTAGCAKSAMLYARAMKKEVHEVRHEVHVIMTLLKPEEEEQS
jgi:hypothetical protein